MTLPEPSAEEKRAFFAELGQLNDDSSESEDEHGSHGATEERHRWRAALCQQKANKPPAVSTSPMPLSNSSDQNFILSIPDKSQPTNPSQNRTLPLQELASTSSQLPRQPLAVLNPRRTHSGPAAVSRPPAVLSDPVDSSISAAEPGRPPLQPLTLKRSVTMPHPLAGTLLPKRRPEPPAPAKSEKKMKKKKEPPRIYTGPQIFGGFRVFYIPDDVNKMRQYRIDRAKEAGAVRTWSLDDATHVVVDHGLTWEEIKSILEPCNTLDRFTVVNDTYFPSCIDKHLLYDYDQKQYEVPGFAKAMLARKSSNPPPPDTVEQLLPASTQRELPPIKPARRDLKKSVAAPETPPVSQASSGPSTVTDIQPVCTDAPSSVHQDPKQGQPVIPSEEPYGDELSECIAEALQSKDLPLDEDDENNHSDGPSNEVDCDSDPGMRSDGERGEKRRKIAKGKHKEISAEKFACNRGGTLSHSTSCPNTRAIEVLQKMCNHYERLNDNPHRINSYRRAITTLKRLPYKVSTYDEAIVIPTIGESLARKIEEIHLTDRLRQLDFANDDPMNATLKLFVGIYGVGALQASRWYAQGHRTLEDLIENLQLSVNQRVGVDHYIDLNTRIPRDEVEALGNYVKAAAAKMEEGLELIIGGSYRRGAPESGDIDFIVTRKGTTSSEQVLTPLRRLTESLEAEGFLVARLSSSKADKGSKWHGCCVLPESHWLSDEPYRPIWRRIDFLAVPESQMGAALIYFTGNDIFNRSMRLLASRRLMRLNQKGLYAGCLRGDNRVKLTEGELVESRDEKKIFDILGVRWREPHERWC